MWIVQTVLKLGYGQLLNNNINKTSGKQFFRALYRFGKELCA